jgi:ParB family chromosome partitioning protein
MRGRARRGVLQDIGAKLAQPPSAATLAALTGGAAAPCSPHDRGRVRAAHTDASEGSARPRVVAIDAIRPSPYQPVGRPPSAAVDAVSAAVALSGSLAALVDDATSLAALPRDARDLAALAADVAARGVEVPLDVRHVATGTEHGGDGARFELLSGHRRLAAARLAGLAHVPVQDRGELDDHDAALAVFRANTHRVDFAPWHEAVSLAALRRQRLAASVSGSVRELAKLMGLAWAARPSCCRSPTRSRGQFSPPSAMATPHAPRTPSPDSSTRPSAGSSITRTRHSG